MTIATIRKRLIDYLQEADDSKVKAMYTLLENDIQSYDEPLTEEQLLILDKERELYVNGQVAPYTKMEALDFIRNGKNSDV